MADEVIRAIATQLSQKPTRLIAAIWTRPVPKTIAFGGVATGSMKARRFVPRRTFNPINGRSSSTKGLPRCDGWKCNSHA